MKTLIVLALIALVAPLYAQEEAEEKIIDKRGISLGLSSGGLGYGGYGGGYSSYSTPVISKSIRISGGYGGGYGGYGGLSSGHGYGRHGF